MSFREREKKSKELERILSNIYEKVYEQITRDDDYPDNIYRLHERYNPVLLPAIRKSIEEIHKIAIDYTGKKMKIDAFLTETDIALIKQETDITLRTFWGVVEREIERTKKNEYMTEVENAMILSLKGASFLGTLATLAGLAVSTITKGLAKATVSKARQLSSTSNFTGPDLRFTGTAQSQGSSQVVTWQTAGDERVCPICAPLDGQTWDVNDSSIPVPGENGFNGTHSNCRCRLVFD